jgi:sugar/nucleoside kinase (ribokinase family)
VAPPTVLTVGETMALLDPAGAGEPQAGSAFTLRVAGAESNVAIALARLGLRAAWISRVGDDPLGAMVLEQVGGEGVDVSRVVRDPTAPTGLFLKWRGPGGSRNLYYRRGTAASRLSPADVPDSALDGVDAVHLTGITTALGYGPRALVHDLARRARGRGIPVSFDPNYRPALWESPRHALAAHRELLPLVDRYLCGEEEGRLLLGVDSAEAVHASLLAAGVREAVVRVGVRGAFVGDGIVVAPARVVDVLDEIGAGDGFAAGYLWGRLRGLGAVESARAGNVVAASALGGTGDWETYCDAAALEAALAPL